ncbi:histidinol-phosphatase [Hydrogenimonas thermophila]|uniref:Histidinol-phosphatase n=1 Tax=Hydrogenimonas thermophila TaxID=223786 RepID=A0A1I5S6I3_9BACT|nr:histidinol-phosphatase [Hydrogenimonas thermophila]WOE69543.1 histidinol-phosphatase [Hydrogenimonas thermophila]WOE72057.1 histidinol-phosphatase [Hydrogenimonas thermophila]SFP66280.1 histidinol-phosphatase (PHP family) [Hydrogenimonas thermophila]
MKRVDLHNHTTRCNHAEGSVDEYVEKAILEEIDIFGFSDHAPMNFDTRYRMSFDEMDAYENDIKNVKEKYADKIEILLGYEVDYLPGYMDERVLNANVDYLIGSVHFIDKWGFDNPEFIGKYEGADIDTIWQEYFNLVENMAKTGLFDIVGHLDLIKVFKFLPKKDIRLIAKNALDAIKKSGMAIEINAAGYRKPIGEAYPSRELLEMAYERDIPITFGSDAHKPEQVGYKKDDIKRVAESVGYNYVVYFKNRERIMVNF